MSTQHTNAAEPVDPNDPLDSQPIAGDPAGYKLQWRVYAIRWYTTLFLMITWIPVSAWLFLRATDETAHVTALAICLLWLVTTMAMVWWTGEFRCPRCSRRYGALGNRKGDTNFTRGFFDRVCANCKLRKFERG